jgi:DNA-binding NtrC family response regulator
MNKILIVEDKPSVSGVLQEFFEKNLSMHVQCAHTGPEATRMLTQQDYDLAVIGLPLAGSTGFDIAALAAREDTPVLLMTGQSDLQFTMQQFAFPHIRKPFTLDALRVAAEQTISDHARQLGRLKISLEKLRVHCDALAKAMDQLDRRLDVARARQHLDHWNFAVARVKEAFID